MECSRREFDVKKAVDDLLEDSWFFENSLRDPRIIMRSWSLPVARCEDEEEEEEARMGDLIRQAMPCQRRVMKSTRSLPTRWWRNGENEDCGSSVVSDATRRVLMPDRGHKMMRNVTRTSSINTWRLGHSSSASLDDAKMETVPLNVVSDNRRRHRRLDNDKSTVSTTITGNGVMGQSLDRCKPMTDATPNKDKHWLNKSRFSHENQHTNINHLPSSLNNGIVEEAQWTRRLSLPSRSLKDWSIQDWVDKGSPEDMKAHIKFWARCVASDVRQECLSTAS
ncbi:hypothetical protein Droror1_Dr00027346 [Drosera rotundifolia]